MRQKRGLAAWLAILFVILSLFSACGKSGTEQGSETNRNSKETTQESATNGDSGETLSDFTVVYSGRSDRTAEKTLAVGLRDSLRTRCGVTLSMATDSDADGTGKVILVGNTACAQSASVLSELTREDWAVRRVGDAIVLAGGCRERLKEAIAYFLENGVASDGSLLAIGHTERHTYEFAQTQLSLASLNLRTTNAANQELREPRIVGFVKETQPDSIGTQECTVSWRTRLDRAFGDIGYQRAQLTHPNPQAMKNYIWYNPKTVKVADAGYFWLSETPTFASQGFGSQYYISAAWAILENLTTGVRYVHINTHLDVNEESIRMQELEVLFSYIDDFRARGLPVFVTGDFNSTPDSPVIQSCLEKLTDSRSAAEKTVSTHTYNAYGGDESATYRSKKTIDYCLFSGPVTVERFNVTEKQNGGWISDHNALTVQATICKR